MIVYRSIDEIREPLHNPVVTIGNFDGVHLGHREIFRRLARSAREIDGVSVVITFDPHPLRIVSSTRTITLINTLEEKITLIGASGVDVLLIIPFDADFAAISAEDFVARYLVEKIGLKRLIIGHDYAFGRQRHGNGALLRNLGNKFSFAVEELQPITDGSTIYSSSFIRNMIADGAVADVVHYLGRNYSLGGTVIHGESRGKSLGFPTANIATVKELIPADGVYAVKVKLDDRLYDAACNIGCNPTFAAGSKTVEVFIFDLNEDLYGKEVRVYFVDRIRNERRFDTVDELITAISADVERCRAILASSRLVAYREYLEAL